MNDLTSAQFRAWLKTRKQFRVHYQDIQTERGQVILEVRNDAETIRLGDCMGAASVLRIEVGGQEVDSLPPQSEGKITLDRMPYFMVHECPPDFAEWLKERTS